MSLDIYAKLKRGTIPSGQQLGTGYIRWPEEERNRLTEPTNEVLWINITHNLGEMASHIPTLDTTLYQIMWRPDEYFKEENIKLGTVLPYLTKGFDYLISHEKELSKYNPKNGWGHYENFVHWLPDYIRACYKWPNAILEISR